MENTIRATGESVVPSYAQLFPQLVQGSSTAPSSQTISLPVAAQSLPEAWANTEYRRAYMESAIEQDVAYQIRENREARSLSQEDLAKAIGSGQSAVSRMEDPLYGRHSLKMLKKIAHAFDCALWIRFVPYSRFAALAADTTPESMYAAPYPD